MVKVQKTLHMDPDMVIDVIKATEIYRIELRAAQAIGYINTHQLAECNYMVGNLVGRITSGCIIKQDLDLIDRIEKIIIPL